MNRLISLFAFIFVSAPTLADSAYEDPPNACYENCTPWMQDLLEQFENQGERLNLEPAVYSGECRHLGQYNPEHPHYAVVMIDRLPNAPESYFSTIFTYFAIENEFQKWDLAEARKNMSPYWQGNGKMIQGRLSTRVEIPYENGSAAYIYWMRQDPETQTLYYITYHGTVQKSFCALSKN